MRENEAIRLLEAVLTREGAEWREESGWVRFRLRHGAAVWETACRAQKDALLLYGRFPFRCGDPDRAGRLCAEINRQLVRGAVFLTEDGYPVYRCRAEMDDVYGAEERLTQALRCSGQSLRAPAT